MKSIAIVYFSGSGHTAQMAEAVRRGAAGAGGIDTVLLPIDGLNRLNSFMGVMGYTSQSPDEPPTVDSGDLLTAEALGQRLAAMVQRLGERDQPASRLQPAVV